MRNGNASRSARASQVYEELENIGKQRYLVDTSSLIYMIENGIKFKGDLYAPRQMIDEMQTHAARGKILKAAADAVKLAPCAPVKEHMEIKADVILAYEAACSEKKRTRDPISQQDINFAVEALKQAMHGRALKVLSEDQHIYKTLEHLLKTEKYRGFADLIEVVSLSRLA